MNTITVTFSDSTGTHSHKLAFGDVLCVSIAHCTPVLAREIISSLSWEFLKKFGDDNCVVFRDPLEVNLCNAIRIANEVVGHVRNGKHVLIIEVNHPDTTAAVYFTACKETWIDFGAYLIDCDIDKNGDVKKMNVISAKRSRKKSNVEKFRGIDLDPIFEVFAKESDKITSMNPWCD